jgi:hypothetical protein
MEEPYYGHEGAKEHGTGFASVWGKFQPADEKRLDPVFLDAGDRVVVLFRLKGLTAESGRFWPLSQTLSTVSVTTGFRSLLVCWR